MNEVHVVPSPMDDSRATRQKGLRMSRLQDPLLSQAPKVTPIAIYF
ncbi:MAG: hypothetical protein M3O15_06585 [Acidobacteriota bacterium]|nr:hypothetical protein [Acidobacteriota bacterium]